MAKVSLWDIITPTEAKAALKRTWGRYAPEDNYLRDELLHHLVKLQEQNARQAN